MKHWRSLTLAAWSGLGLAIAVGGCASDDPHQNAKIGAAVGAVTGAVVGHQIDDSSGKWVGAAVGALAGAAVGNYMDEQEREFEQTLQREREANEMEIERLRDETLKLTMDSEVSFDFARAEIKPAFEPSLDKLAALIVKYDRTVVHIVGHTDSIGSEAYNQELSQRRADAVSDYLVDDGVPRERLRTEGRGEREPRAINETEAGRQLNRRVEVFVKPIVEGEEQRAFESPDYY